MPYLFLCVLCVLLRLNSSAIGATVGDRHDVSFQKEVQHAIDQGLNWLEKTQNTNGFWSNADHPAVTALALSAFMGEPFGKFQKNPTLPVQRGYKFILQHAKPDGAIYGKDLANYNTAISMMALIAARDRQYDPTIRHARQWLLGQQIDLGEKGKIDSPFDGGVGYGDKGDHSDMNNTLTALEALYYSKQLDTDKNLAGAKDLNWPAAIHFLESCQNLPSHNKERWASDDPKNKGGFIYLPGESKASTETNANGKVAFRSYGSISYAGLLSYIYADLKHDDPRVLAAYDWLRENFSLKENPGMGPQGYYYYLNLMTKALNIYGVDKLELKDGKKIDWRHEVAMKLINLQKPDGSWANANGRWWEKDSVLVTAYSLISLEIIYRGL